MDGKAGEAGEGDPAVEVDVYVHWGNGLRCGRERQTADGRRYVCMHIVAHHPNRQYSIDRDKI